MSDMLDVEMAPAARTTIETSLAVEPGEEVLIIADARTVGIGRAFASAAAAAGARTTTAIMPLLESHGNEPPDTIAAAMAAADAVVTPTTHAITHTRARLDAADAGVRIAIIRGVTEDMLIEGAMTADFEAVRDVTTRIAERIDAADAARVTSEQGTDVT
ncbi:MAG: aminopeptidase, partial [Salinirussus sp.]